MHSARARHVIGYPFTQETRVQNALTVTAKIHQSLPRLGVSSGA